MEQMFYFRENSDRTNLNEPEFLPGTEVDFVTGAVIKSTVSLDHVERGKSWAHITLDNGIQYVFKSSCIPRINAGEKVTIYHAHEENNVLGFQIMEGSEVVFQVLINNGMGPNSSYGFFPTKKEEISEPVPN